MRFRYTILFAEDVPLTLDFYRRAFGFETAFLHEGNDYGELITGDTKLAFSSRALMTDLGKNPALASPQNPTFELAFETEDVASALARAVEAGAPLLQELRVESWGQSTAYVADINGYLVDICSPIGV